MRSLVLACLTLTLSASPASAAVIEFDDRSSPEDDEQTFAIVVRAAPGEANAITVSRVLGGILIHDTGAPLSGECAPAAGGARHCAGFYAGVDVYLGDGGDTLDQRVDGTVLGEAGDDDIRVSDGYFIMLGGPGADRLDGTGAARASVSYAGHTEGVSIRLNGLADDGAAGEGDNVIGQIAGLSGGDGDDVLEAGGVASSLFGAAGNDTLVGGPADDYMTGEAGDDELRAGEGPDRMLGGPGADAFSGGGGVDAVWYDTVAPLRLTIGDGPNDGASGEGDDIRDDVESVSGGFGDDLIVGDANANELHGLSGQDVLRGMGGPDELRGWGDGDVLDGGPGPDMVRSRLRRRGLDRALLIDGEPDRLECASRGLVIEADAVDSLIACAPEALVRLRGPMRRGRRAALTVRCPPNTSVPCRGRVWIESRRRARLSRRIAFGPIQAGERGRVRVLVRGPLPARGCVLAVTATRRNDGLDTRTVTGSRVRCLG